jgi:hypothetical protein
VSFRLFEDWFAVHQAILLFVSALALMIDPENLLPNTRQDDGLGVVAIQCRATARAGSCPDRFGQFRKFEAADTLAAGSHQVWLLPRGRAALPAP